MSETSWSCFERSGKTEKTMSCLGSKLAIILLERGMPSRRASSKHIDYVPAICTHRPSLLPMLVGYRLRDVTGPCLAAKLNPCSTSRGSKSRNKVAVGEPAAGSFRKFSNKLYTEHSLAEGLCLSVWVGTTHNGGCLGFPIDEGRGNM